MDLEWRWVNAVVPKMTQKLLRRYSLLLTIRQMQPVGRRSLAEKQGLTERTVRTDLDSLLDTGLVSMQTNGVWLTDDGQKAVFNLQPLVADLTGLRKKERLLKTRLGLKDCLIVSGDSDDRQMLNKQWAKLLMIYFVSSCQWAKALLLSWAEPQWPPWQERYQQRLPMIGN